jgi:hypothetical protein
MAVWTGLRMLWHGLVGDPNTMRPRQSSAVLRLLPSEGFFSVFILGINSVLCGKQAQNWQKGHFPPLFLIVTFTLTW